MHIAGRRKEKYPAVGRLWQVSLSPLNYLDYCDAMILLWLWRTIDTRRMSISCPACLCFPVTVFTSLWIEREAEIKRDHDAELQKHCQVNQLMLKTHQCGKCIDRCVLCIYSHAFITCNVNILLQCCFCGIVLCNEWPWCGVRAFMASKGWIQIILAILWLFI